MESAFRQAALAGELLYEQLVDALPHPVFTTTADGLCDFVSAKYVEYTGLTADDAAQMGWLEAIHPDDREQVRASWRDGGGPMICRMRGRDNTYRWFDVRASALRASHGSCLVVARWVFICSDVHESREAEIETRKTQHMQAIGQLAGGVAHDFNNLLTIVMACTDEILGTMADTDPHREPLLDTRLAVQRATTLTRDLLAFSRQEQSDPRVVDFNEVVIEATRMIGRLLGEDIRLTTSLTSSDSLVRIDPGQWTSVLVNLAVNARHAMPRGGVLTLATSIASPHLLLAVTDTGSGFGPEVAARLFEPFFTTKNMGKGTGLGLAVVQAIVEQSGGYIEVESTEGVGTTFFIGIPLAIAERVDAVASSSASFDDGDDVTTSRKTRKTPEATVLFVEDETTIRRMAARCLEARGFEVLQVGDGEDALRVLQERDGHVDILVTDVVLPRMDGPRLVDAVGKQYPRVKVLFTSGYAADDVLRYGVSTSKSSAFLQKPYTPRHLVRKMREILAIKGAQSPPCGG